MIQVSGLRFSWSAKEPRGARVSEVKVGTEALDAGRRYRVATNSMLAAGGHNYRAFLAGVDRREEGSQFEILREALRRRREVTAPEDRRIGRIDE
jgi:5'-nucleotidase